MNNLGERLNFFVENHLNTSIFKIEKELDMPKGTLWRIIKNPETSMGHDKLVKISNHFPELNMDWLLSGEGQMIEHSILRETPAKFNYDAQTDIDRILGIYEKDKDIQLQVVHQNTLLITQQKEFLAQQKELLSQHKDLIGQQNALISQQDRLIGVIEKM